ncbi:hypothetical protein LZ655_02895 [Klebsiella pneumoniae]|jgi:hypothetical protein|nr:MULTISPECIES: hypothetical protein [Klebsiella]EKW2606783.1 hypothetical protein [Klebsiella quasipneumoniae]EKY4220490.1 hypothetical protein [Escherichia coli]MDU7714626.1 hypothetical protein [Clostridium butyricum]HCB1312115.1 hypothetical protein [Klebsiella quasipneumoniae subsp. similipneumoniae]EJO2875013.1 hypothetical protein [Klebsiella pneumoniae]
MEKSYLPQWFIDLSTLTGVVGFTITIVGFIFTYIIFNQVKELKFKYLSKARLPQLNEDLSKSASEILKHLSQKEIHFELLSSEFSKCAGLVENILLKLDSSNNSSAKSLLGKLKKRKWLIGPFGHIQITDESEGWKIYNELGSFTTFLTQLIKDSHWE